MDEAPKKKKARSLARQTRARDCPPSRMIAWDMETTRIGVGTPAPLYITAFSESENFSFRRSITSIAELGYVLKTYFLVKRFRGVKFVGWNSNHFDAYFAAAALVECDEYIIRPYLTRSKNLRGFRVQLKGDGKKDKGWEFLDGIAMTGIVGFKLSKFLELFAPEYKKLTENIDFEKEDFDSLNPKHVEYAMRDSEGLYYAMREAEDIMLAQFNQCFTSTMGNACIKIFKSNIPENVVINPLSDEALEIVRSYVMRGGFCFCARRYDGPVWKYDLNQAYAAAMRDAKLPSGRGYFCDGKEFLKTSFLQNNVYIAEITAHNNENKIPFYCRQLTAKNRVESGFCVTSIDRTWLTSIEIEQLKAEGWRITLHRVHWFTDHFSMREFVDKLEYTRMHCAGGPKGATGTMIKATGNHSYGKTVEQLAPMEILLSKECPDGFLEYVPESEDAVMPFPFVWARKLDEDEVVPRDYHHPHIGAFITAHVRMVVRRAALVAPDEWIYADTDCVVFSKSVSQHLDIHASRYGAWKQESDGEHYRFIAKKVYASHDAAEKHAKGMRVKDLKREDFENWFNGIVPVQYQIQRNNFIKVMQGANMYRPQTRRGTAIVK